jgi:predicted nucleic acid-binding protein
MLIVDTNVVAYLLIEGEKTEQARSVWAADPDWRAPRLLSYELANVFRGLVRQRALSLETGLGGMASAVSLVHALQHEPSTARILEIAVKLNLTVYDACYLASAESEGGPLVTEDARLLRAAPQIARPLSSFGG